MTDPTRTGPPSEPAMTDTPIPADQPDLADATNDNDLPEENTDQVGWLIEDFDPANPFTASIVFTDGRHDIWADLNPTALAHLHDALGAVRTAQRAAILGTTMEDPAAAPLASTSDAAEPSTKTPAASRKWSRKTIILATMGGFVGLCIVYGLAAGAVLI